MLAAQKGVAVPQFLERVSDARRRSDALFNLVCADSLYKRPIPERHRIIFYVGHLEPGDSLLLGTDLEKLSAQLLKAYDDEWIRPSADLVFRWR